MTINAVLKSQIRRMCGFCEKDIPNDAEGVFEGSKLICKSCLLVKALAPRRDPVAILKAVTLAMERRPKDISLQYWAEKLIPFVSDNEAVEKARAALANCKKA